jgi:hypothetical protein
LQILAGGKSNILINKWATSLVHRSPIWLELSVIKPWQTTDPMQQWPGPISKTP